MIQLSNNRVQSRLLRVFLLQLIMISMVTVISVLTAGLIAERLLVNKALRGEADYFWSNRAANADFPLPRTLNLASFFSSDQTEPVPASFTALGLGQHRVDDDQQHLIVHVSERNGERLYLLFSKGMVTNLAFYFGVLPLCLVLLTMYGFAYLTYLLSKQAVSPITRLASVIERFDFNKREASELNLASLDQPSDSETAILSSALNHFVERSNASIERERNFTRFASHELRTPVAVIQGSVSTLELLNLEDAPGRAVQRIKRTSRHMGDLLNSLLILAREENQTETESCEPFNVNDLAKTLAGQLSKLHSDKNNKMHIEHQKQLFVKAPESVLSIVLSNILGNAFNYTQDGEIRLVIDDKKIVISDTGVGMDKRSLSQAFEPFFRANADDAPQQHQGLGLAIVRQGCRNYGWEITLDSDIAVGTRVVIEFAQ